MSRDSKLFEKNFLERLKIKREFLHSPWIIATYARYPTVSEWCAKIVQLLSFPKVLRPLRRAAARSSGREARGRGAISVIPARQILGYRTFEGPCAFRRPIPLRNRLEGGGKAKRAGRSSFSIQAMSASPVPRVQGHREIRWEVECVKVVLVASRNL